MNRLIRKILENARSKRGSTIVGVLAALVFITLVTSFMVKNTGAQAAANIGYGTAMTMHSTVMSGIMATEAVLADNTNADKVTKAFKDKSEGENNVFVPGLETNGGKMIPLSPTATNQFFNSKLYGITKNTGNEHKQVASVDVRSGTKSGGKGLKRALAIVEVGGVNYEPPTDAVTENITCPPQPDPVPEPGSTTTKVKYVVPIKEVTTVTIDNTANNSAGAGSDNAVYMAGKLQDGNNGMEIKEGGATFEEDVKFQNKPAIFHGEVFFQQDVYFEVDGCVFYGNTYFNSNVRFQNLCNNASKCTDVGGGIKAYQMFRDTTINGTTIIPRVGVNRTFHAENRRILMPGNFYINGNFGSGTTQIGWAKANSANDVPKASAYYTSNFSTGYITNNVKDFNIGTGTPYKMDNNSPLLASDKLNMKNLEERRETPLLNLTELKQKIQTTIKAQATGNASWNFPTVDVYSSGTYLDVDKLNTAFNTASGSKQLYEGHLVVEVKNGLNTLNTKGKTFNNKVIFLVTGGTFESNGIFYNSGTNASTMIYIGPGNSAKLGQFGLGDENASSTNNYLFRGYIYIDADNTSTNSFKWFKGTSFVGAFHNFSTKPFTWNTGNGNDAVPPLAISYDAKVLEPYFTLKKGGYVSSAANNNTAIDVINGLDDNGAKCTASSTKCTVTKNGTPTPDKIDFSSDGTTKTTTSTVSDTVIVTTVANDKTTIVTTITNTTTTEIETTVENSTPPPPPTIEPCEPGSYTIPGSPGNFVPASGLTSRAKGYYFW